MPSVISNGRPRLATLLGGGGALLAAQRVAFGESGGAKTRPLIVARMGPLLAAVITRESG